MPPGPAGLCLGTTLRGSPVDLSTVKLRECLPNLEAFSAVMRRHHAFVRSLDVGKSRPDSCDHAFNHHLHNVQPDQPPTKEVGCNG